MSIIKQYLIQSEKMASLGTLTAGVAHEINNPLNFISGGVNIVSEAHKEVKSGLSGELNKRIAEAIDMINEGIKRAAEIVKALMTFSYRGTPVLKHADINHIIDNTLLFLNTKISSDVEIKKRYQLLQSVPIFTDKMHQVIMNILDNAIYAVRQSDTSKRKIAISTIRKDNNAVITISNNGPLIPEKDLTQIFDPFFTTKPPDQGAGLGLSICYSLIGEHEGKIYAKNEEDGVSFVIELPFRS